MADWIYILNPNKDTLDGEPSDKETMRRLAQEEPELDLWLSRRNRMECGDRLWFFFTHPESAVAAVAEVDKEPRDDPENPGVWYLVGATLLNDATQTLYRAPRDPGRTGTRAGAIGTEGEAARATGAAETGGSLTGGRAVDCLEPR
ncbi:hypothetical protein ABZ759_14985 [Streptomyces sp. NPDC047860]|uniref:hypothetical protein n=1 Tax=Streptomyces sp. NPDC047860 TaxID=3155743 RepID=UPI003407AC23